MNNSDTIAAVATPAGRGGIGVIRISGAKVTEIASSILGKLPLPRYATFSDFVDREGVLLDQGLAIYFPAPNSFTGEDVLKLQGHGGPIVLDLILNNLLGLGARLARPGEFSAQIHALVDQLIWLRSYIEAGIDFVDEEIDLLADGQVVAKLEKVIAELNQLVEKSQQGYLLKEGMRIVLVGEPNVGKSSLLNCLSGRDTAIVTPIPGTTRDVVREQIQLDGAMPLHITDTAGLRETDDPVEQEGIRRTKLALKEADLVIVLVDDRHPDDHSKILTEIEQAPLIVRNKIDLSDHKAGMSSNDICYISAKTGAGIDSLKDYLKQKMGLDSNTEGNFMARRRHLDALETAKTAFATALSHAHNYQNELLAEELRLAQQALGEITGEFTADDLLGQIFSSFCIGK
jgi:tRNA modification GTPase